MDTPYSMYKNEIRKLIYKWVCKDTWNYVYKQNDTSS